MESPDRIYLHVNRQELFCIVIGYVQLTRS
jgi:hypothetical protein